MYERSWSFCGRNDFDFCCMARENAVPGKVDPEVLFTFGVTAVTASVILWAISLFTISFVTTTKESHQEKLNELNYADNS